MKVKIEMKQYRPPSDKKKNNIGLRLLFRTSSMECEFCDGMRKLFQIFNSITPNNTWKYFTSFRFLEWEGERGGVGETCLSSELISAHNTWKSIKGKKSIMKGVFVDLIYLDLAVPKAFTFASKSRLKLL